MDEISLEKNNVHRFPVSRRSNSFERHNIQLLEPESFIIYVMNFNTKNQSWTNIPIGSIRYLHETYFKTSIVLQVLLAFIAFIQICLLQKICIRWPKSEKKSISLVMTLCITKRTYLSRYQLFTPTCKEVIMKATILRSALQVRNWKTPMLFMKLCWLVMSDTVVFPSGEYELIIFMSRDYWVFFKRKNRLIIWRMSNISQNFW